MEVTDTALRTNLWLCPCTVAAFDPDEDTFVDQKLWLGILDLAHDDDYLTRPAILLEHMGIVDLYRRVYNQLIVPLNPRIKYSTMNISLSTSSLGEVQALADHSTITVTRTLDEAFQKDVGILLQQSPINAVKTQPNQERRPVTGPVYVVMTPDAKVPSITDSGGSHPLFSSYQSRSSQISAPWTFEKCKHWGVERFLGGIHFLDLTFDKGDTTKHRADIVVVWGMHEDFRKVDEELAKDPTATPWKPWCRVFDMVAFMKSAKTSPDDLRPTQLYRRIEAMSPGQIQEKIENQRRRLCLHGYETFWIQQESGPKRLFPDSCEDEWVEDRLSHIMDDTQHMVDVTAKVSRTEGLGRTIFELQVKVEATERAGWRASDEPQRKKKAGAFPANDEIIDPFRHSNRHRRP
ncbi:Fc.00g074720.m01.CDS01 [Cosmosporella sp. VM-42]